jgi:tetratricopeptide (TPR) repeat protein
MTDCHYCKKKLPMFGGKDFPAHPKDVGFDDSAFSCEDCWRTRVAGIGLTVATGSKKADVETIKTYYKNALNFKKSGNIPGALENYEKFVDLSLKCLGYKRNSMPGRGWVRGGDLDSMGDLYAASGNIAKARESYQTALALLKRAQTPGGIMGGLERAYIKQIENKLMKLPVEEAPGRAASVQGRYCKHCGASIAIDAAYCAKCGKQQ